MNLKSATPADPAANRRRARWLMPLFFAVWSAMVVLAVWWLAAAKPDQPNLLIALDHPEATSWLAQARRWIEAHVEVDWAYPWILLAPYVLWLGLRVNVEKRALPMRLALHLAAGAAFMCGSQALTNRLEARRPKAVFIKHEDVVRRVRTGDTNETMEITRKIEWPDRWSASVTNIRPDGLFPPDTPFAKPTEQKEARLRDPKRAEVLVLRTELIQSAAGTTLVTNRVYELQPTNELARSLASRLAPVIEEHLNAFRTQRSLAAPRKLSAALDGLAYVGLIGLAQAVHFRRRLAEREKQSMLLESRLTQSRLRALQAQLQPHFLFNTLNGIAVLVRRDPRVAEDMLTSLSELLRLSLGQSGRQEIPLRDELEFLDRYLELQQMRFGDRLRIERHIDSAALDCFVPSLLLQPLVENAIRHGIEPSPNLGLVRITARRDGERLRLSVEDNGVGFGKAQQKSTRSGNGVGMTSVRERLAGLYADDHEFAMDEKSSGGVIVRMRIPARVAPVDTAGHQSATTA